jgi:transglutaminase-like putative cysteine protease
MRLSAGCEIVVRAAEESPVVTMLRPRRSQNVLEDRFVLSRQLPFTQFSDVFGNVCQRFTVPRGELRIFASARVDSEATVATNRHAPRTHVSKLPDASLHFTLPSRYCPSDRLMPLAKQIALPTLTGYEQVQAIRDYVHRKLEYRPGVSNSSTDAEQTLAAGAGVCRDFAHVAIALCRAIDIPARMVAGYLRELAPMDLHAWFEAYVGDRWYTFDATEDNLLGGRIVLGYGRDAADVAFLSDFGSLELISMRTWVDEQARDTLESPSRSASA